MRERSATITHIIAHAKESPIPHLSDGPQPPLLVVPGVVVLDRTQSLAACAEVAALLAWWLTRALQPDGGEAAEG